MKSTDSRREVGIDCVRQGTPFEMESLWRACERQESDRATDPLVGRRLGDVTLVRVIADGGMGRIYEGQQQAPRRTVAVKVIRPGFLSKPLVARFVREASVLASLCHPRISQIFSAGTFDVGGAMLPYFVMEFIPGARSITDYVRNATLSADNIVAIFRDVCDAIAHGHDVGVVHRDLKPSNILVDQFGNPKVIDFGVARSSDGGGPLTSLTDAGQVLGTLQYMSPEQLRGDNSRVDTRSDVYSLGVILYELLVGSPPLRLEGKRLPEAIRAIDEHRPPPVRSLNRAVPRQVARVVERCLARERGARFADARELHRALDAAVLRQSVPSLFVIDGFPDKRRFGRLGGMGCLGAVVVLAGAYLKPPYLFAPRHSLRGPAAASGSSNDAAGGGGLASEPRLAERSPFSFLEVPATVTESAHEFRFAFRDIYQPDASKYLVQTTGMRAWTDWFMFPRISYWAPTSNHVEGVLVYRFELPGRARSIRVRARSDCWDFSSQPGGVGRGASAIEISTDGKSWAAVENNLEPRRWGRVISIDQELPHDMLGSDVLWFRVRCLSEGAPVENGYNVAQFGRTRPGDEGPVFEVHALLAQERRTHEALKTSNCIIGR